MYKKQTLRGLAQTTWTNEGRGGVAQPLRDPEWSDARGEVASGGDEQKQRLDDRLLLRINDLVEISWACRPGKGRGGHRPDGAVGG